MVHHSSEYDKNNFTGMKNYSDEDLKKNVKNYRLVKKLKKFELFFYLLLLLIIFYIALNMIRIKFR